MIVPLYILIWAAVASSMNKSCQVFAKTALKKNIWFDKIWEASMLFNYLFA